MRDGSPVEIPDLGSGFRNRISTARSRRIATEVNKTTGAFHLLDGVPPTRGCRRAIRDETNVYGRLPGYSMRVCRRVVRSRTGSPHLVHGNGNRSGRTGDGSDGLIKAGPRHLKQVDIGNSHIEIIGFVPYPCTAFRRTEEFSAISPSMRVFPAPASWALK